MKNSSNFFVNKRPVKSASAERVAKGLLTEDQLGELIRDACKQMGWHFLWLRKTTNSSEGVLDLKLIPIRPFRTRHESDAPGALYRRAIIERELKGHDARGRLGKPTPAQLETIELTNAAGGDANIWIPADWFSGKILDELR